MPGQVQLDLLQAGIITEPYREDNDVLQRWIPMDNWTYTSTFLLDPSIDLTLQVRPPSNRSGPPTAPLP